MAPAEDEDSMRCTVTDELVAAILACPPIQLGLMTGTDSSLHVRYFPVSLAGAPPLLTLHNSKAARPAGLECSFLRVYPQSTHM